MKILVTNHFLTQYTGSELAGMDVALAFRALGHEVTLACLEQGEPLLSELKGRQLFPVALSELAGQSFDIIWAQHFTTLDMALFELGISARHIIFSSLSPYEPLESPPLCSERIHLLLANSPETQACLQDMGFSAEQIRLFANPVADEFFAPQWLTPAAEAAASPDASPAAIKLALVSNHVPHELRVALPLLAEQGVAVTEFGLGGQQRLMTAELLSEFDGIISIGRTVQYGLAMGLPVFCYDRFAGPGWLGQHNIKRAGEYNFSGRCTPQVHTAEQLVTTLVEGFTGAQREATLLRAYASDQYRLSKHLTAVLQNIEQQPPLVVSAACYQAIGLRHRHYWQQQGAVRYVNIYGDVGQGFSERLSVRRVLSAPYQHVTISIELSALGASEALRAVRLDPFNAPCVAQLQRLTLIGERRLELAGQVSSNALHYELHPATAPLTHDEPQRRYYFFNPDPQWQLVLDEPISAEWQRLELEFTLLATEDAALIACEPYLAQLGEWVHSYHEVLADPAWRAITALRQLRHRVVSFFKS